MEMNENPLKIENIYVIYFWICLDKNLLFFYENYNHKLNDKQEKFACSQILPLPCGRPGTILLVLLQNLRSEGREKN